MRLLLIGGGGREHALAWKLAQSPQVETIYAAPGNPGIALLDKCECIDLPLQELEKLADYAEANCIDLTVVGPEASLVEGIADVFKARGLALFGPSKAAAELEGSKAFSKQLMEKYGIPTAFFKVCEDIETAKAYIKEKGAPIVVKADGLAAGKGVVVAMTEAEAFAAVDDMMGDLKFGGAGARVVLEEFMEGEEASLLAFTDGDTIVSMIAAQDHKRINDNDEGPNTGGMGTYAPAPVMTDILRLKAVEKVLKPTIAAMKAEGRPFKGVIFFGLMLTPDGPKVLEYNARFGDPEAQVVLPRLENDIVDVFEACIDGTLDQVDLKFDNDRATVCVILASDGYPVEYKKGFPIEGLEKFKGKDDYYVFHSGTKFNENGQIVTNGGRVLGVTATGKDLKEARKKAYEATEWISFENKYMRHDIGKAIDDIHS